MKHIVCCVTTIGAKNVNKSMWDLPDVHGIRWLYICAWIFHRCNFVQCKAIDKMFDGGKMSGFLQYSLHWQCYNKHQMYGGAWKCLHRTKTNKLLKWRNEWAEFCVETQRIIYILGILTTIRIKIEYYCSIRRRIVYLSPCLVTPC